MCPDLILASASPIRRQLLERALVPVTVKAAAIDEAEIKRNFRAQDISPGECARHLATLKARRVSGCHPDAIVLGCDQLLDCSGVWFDKPMSRDRTRDQLRILSGKTHRLSTAAVAVQAGEVVWQTIDYAELTMRVLTEEWLDKYLEQAEPDCFQCVGGYQVEAMGIQLFDRIDGDYFTILGLPLLPVLAFIREQGIVGR